MQKYLAKNMNFFVLLLIILVIITSVGLGVYYQMSFSKVTSQYIDKQNELKTVQAELERTSSILDETSQKYNETSQKLSETSQDLEKYDSLYANITSELDKTKTELSDEISNLEGDLEDSNHDLEVKVAEIVTLNKQLSDTQENLTMYRGWYLSELNETQKWIMDYDILKEEYDDLQDACNTTG